MAFRFSSLYKCHSITFPKYVSLNMAPFPTIAPVVSYSLQGNDRCRSHVFTAVTFFEYDKVFCHSNKRLEPIHSQLPITDAFLIIEKVGVSSLHENMIPLFTREKANNKIGENAHCSFIIEYNESGVVSAQFSSKRSLQKQGLDLKEKATQ
ncbi:hypothetical protein VNO77_24287 [Canavalia gladiata]|uniref:Uncharacterized protein n=1 Tax=Canavalia gladiata TaxID=3824 RepID=A0AAN9L797_CANGL